MDWRLCDLQIIGVIVLRGCSLKQCPHPVAVVDMSTRQTRSSLIFQRILLKGVGSVESIRVDY